MPLLLFGTTCWVSSSSEDPKSGVGATAGRVMRKGCPNLHPGVGGVIGDLLDGHVSSLFNLSLAFLSSRWDFLSASVIQSEIHVNTKIQVEHNIVLTDSSLHIEHAAVLQAYFHNYTMYWI